MPQSPVCARWRKYVLDFTFEARTSRGAMWHKPTYFIEIWRPERPEVVGLGECNYFPGLSPESETDFEAALQRACDSGLQDVAPYSALVFGIETAMASLRAGGGDVLFPSPWTQGEGVIPINGLVWMGSKQLMLKRLREKIDAGYRCIKLKIGGIAFADEFDILAAVRSLYGPNCLEIRLDANGAFTPDNALLRLEQLSQFHIHSLEQPIRAGQPEAMARICAESPIPIALDEELIGMRSAAEKAELLSLIRPAYIILKPALCGGFAHADAWISAAIRLGIGWWATSALESNVGLSAIAQWTAAHLFSPTTPHLSPIMPQGLGTGALYNNNILPTPLRLHSSHLNFQPPH